MVRNYRVLPGAGEAKPYESWKNEVAIFASMKLALKRIFGGNPAGAAGMGINQETLYITEQ